MKILANSTFVYEHLAIVDHRWYIFRGLNEGESDDEMGDQEKNNQDDDDINLLDSDEEGGEMLDSGKSTIGGERWRGARVQTWNLLKF